MQSEPEAIRLCAQCGGTFSRTRARSSKFCSKECRNQNYYQRANLPRTPFDERHARGAASELRVAIDLIERGYEVFRAVNQFCSCDLAAIIGRKMARIEVRTGFKNKITGHVSARRPEANKADILAIVLQDGQIIYEPSIASFSSARAKLFKASA